MWSVFKCEIYTNSCILIQFYILFPAVLQLYRTDSMHAMSILISRLTMYVYMRWSVVQIRLCFRFKRHAPHCIKVYGCGFPLAKINATSFVRLLNRKNLVFAYQKSYHPRLEWRFIHCSKETHLLSIKNYSKLRIKFLENPHQRHDLCYHQ